MTALLPPIPRLFFTILEPLSNIAGFLYATLYPHAFYASQTSLPTPSPPLHPNTQITIYQLGNEYLVLALISIGVLYTTTEIRVVRSLISVLAVGDVGHLFATAAVLGWDGVLRVNTWSWVTVGNLGVAAFLLVVRVAFLMGVFGRVEEGKAKRG